MNLTDRRLLQARMRARGRRYQLCRGCWRRTKTHSGGPVRAKLWLQSAKQVRAAVPAIPASLARHRRARWALVHLGARVPIQEAIRAAIQAVAATEPMA